MMTNQRIIDNMSKEDIITHLVRIASYLSTTYRLNEASQGRCDARKTFVSQGRCDVCASVLDDFAINFGIDDTFVSFKE